jgi:hypothetical protein
MSEVGLALLLDRVGGRINTRMRDILEKHNAQGLHALPTQSLKDRRHIWPK